ncbi:MAG: hypothetical protein J6Z17_06065, partial [Treponema sp.]|nr:hypothetical protein [Treponema sp.]
FVQSMVILGVFVSIYEKSFGQEAITGIFKPSVLLFLLYAGVLVFFKFVAPEYWKIEMYIERYSFLIRSFMIRTLNLDSTLLFLKNLFSVENAAVLLFFIIYFTVIFVKNMDIRKTCSIMKSPLAVFFFFSIIDLWNNSGAGSVKADGFWNVWLIKGNGINFLFYFIPYFVVTVLSIIRFFAPHKEDNPDVYGVVPFDTEFLKSRRFENFEYNFKVLCRNAETFSEAMRYASMLYENLPKQEKNKFKKERKLVGNEEFKERLKLWYKEAPALKINPLEL